MGEGGNQDDTVKLSLQGQSWGDLEFWLPSLDLKKTLPPVSGAVVLNLWGLIPLRGRGAVKQSFHGDHLSDFALGVITVAKLVMK